MGTGTLVLLGYFNTEAIKQIEQGLQLVMVGITVVVLALIFFLIPRFIRERDSVSISSYEDNRQT